MPENMEWEPRYKRETGEERELFLGEEREREREQFAEIQVMKLTLQKRR